MEATSAFQDQDVYDVEEEGRLPEDQHRVPRVRRSAQAIADREQQREREEEDPELQRDEGEARRVLADVEPLDERRVGPQQAVVAEAVQGADQDEQEERRAPGQEEQ